MNESTVPIDIETAFEILTDLRKVAGCLPGGVLEFVDGESYTESVEVKVGPIVVTYQGTARLVDVDRAAKSARIATRGKETRGSSTAEVNVTATADGTLATVRTDFTVTGSQPSSDAG